MKSLMEQDAFNEIKNRLQFLKRSSKPQWGSMSVDQMLKHCSLVLEVSMGRRTLGKAPFPFRLFAPLIKSALYNDKPYKQGLPTASSYKNPSAKNFDNEQKYLLNQLDEFVSKTATFPSKHPWFGKMTPSQWSKSQYKHLDHHLKQFGV